MQRESIYCLKLGGSLITKKAMFCEPDREAVRDFGAELAGLRDRLRGRLIVILGGGSYGNGIPTRFNFDNDSTSWRLEDLSRMTIGMTELSAIVIGEWRAFGLACHPFQLAAIVSGSAGRERLDASAIANALGMGLIPVLTGDLILHGGEHFAVFSSDRVPGLLAQLMPIERVVVLTDVPGVIDRSRRPADVIRKITPTNSQRALSQSMGSERPDITGGMRTKVLAMLAVSALGVEAVIADGRKDGRQLARALFDADPPGTHIVPDALGDKVKSAC